MKDLYNSNKKVLYLIFLIVFISILVIPLGAGAKGKGKPAKPPKGDTEYSSSVVLQDIDSHFNSPTGAFRCRKRESPARSDSVRVLPCVSRP